MLNGMIPAALLSLALLAGCSSKERSTKSKQAALYYGAGTQALMAQDYTQALTSLLKANELDPGNTEILTNLGMAYYFKGDRDLAVQHLHQALKVSDKNSDARMNLASIKLGEGKVADAETLYKQVLKDLTYDKQARTYYNLALIEIDHRRNVAAGEKYLELSLKEDQNYCPASLKLGMLSYSRRQFNTALKNFRDATLGTCYESPAPHFQQALTLVELRRLDEARAKFDEITTRFPKTVFAVKARNKLIELRELESSPLAELEARAPRKVLQSPEF
jgi:Flp pilus assembly protein TadD